MGGIVSLLSLSSNLISSTMTTTASNRIKRTETGSFFNLMMGNNRTLPVVGKGATVLLWTDRHAYEVIWVSDNQMECKIQRYDPERTDSHGMSDCQGYKYEKLTDEVLHIQYRNRAWRQKDSRIVWTKEVMDKADEAGFFRVANVLTKEQYEQAFDGDRMHLVPGITRVKTTWPKINILFGEKREYYDYSF